MGGFLSGFIEFEKELEDMKWEEWKKCAIRGNATAALCVQERGGIPSIPKKEEVMNLISQRTSFFL